MLLVVRYVGAVAVVVGIREENSASEYSAPSHTPLHRAPVLRRRSSRRLGVPVICFQEMEIGLRWFILAKSEKLTIVRQTLREAINRPNQSVNEPHRDAAAPLESTKYLRVTLLEVFGRFSRGDSSIRASCVSTDDSRTSTTKPGTYMLIGEVSVRFGLIVRNRQAFLSQSEDDRKAAEEREAAAASEAKGMQQAVREAEDRLQDAKAELEVHPCDTEGMFVPHVTTWRVGSYDPQCSFFLFCRPRLPSDLYPSE